MKTLKDYNKWISLITAVIALGITIIFYFKRVFFDDAVLIGLGRIQLGATIVAIVFTLLFIRYWQSKVSLIILLFVIYGIMNIKVGIH